MSRKVHARKSNGDPFCGTGIQYSSCDITSVKPPSDKINCQNCVRNLRRRAEKAKKVFRDRYPKTAAMWPKT